jgi:HAE1 family hydrophobic/amphiphilic exporter-1
MEASGISALSIRHPIATSLVMVGILFVGIVAYPLLPVAPLPQVDFPTIQVTASYPGASPETMASSVAQPLERQFSQIPDVSEMTSSSALGTTRITLQFNLDRDIDAAANDAKRPSMPLAGSCRRTCRRRRPTGSPTRPMRQS